MEGGDKQKGSFSFHMCILLRELTASDQEIGASSVLGEQQYNMVWFFIYATTITTEFGQQPTPALHF